MRIFILEDSPVRIATFRRKLIGHDLTIAESAQQAINTMRAARDVETRSSRFDLIFLDHDLGGEEMVGTEGANTGSEVVRWMALEMGVCPTIVVHSLNAPAATYMIMKLTKAGFDCHYIPFTTLNGKLDDPNFITPVDECPECGGFVGANDHVCPFE